ncbi:aspartyl/asparaginyl beta-hydroxylase domain-containing protein [Paraglaciecola polaris]|uniref:Aspartyl/asparaginyl beta-hydroxylase n=1 Tax=Paraglaciecola polaris LMG 21857 TaxID=1129793 RepID=K6ZFC1_9ALTE|nr:aspartyl/asparaginyl beta-hydroxylase domain-containing protein [Paraglaciecola polaris]GAC34741.1 aspartyl/asparaginyl beta-hydroxylase [Paraglaciecola polaris LMG 21857]|tara:strand:+ start:2382 stop:3572 length:1191 start_codon:yes stop_codon:yes gene_type:complete
MHEPSSVQPRLQLAIQSLQQGKMQQARTMFESLCNEQPSVTQAWFGLAYVCGQLEDFNASIAAIGHVLDHEPKNVKALIFKADQLVYNKQERMALSFYDGALQLTSKQANLPDEIVRGLQRGMVLREKYDTQYREYLLSALTKKGYERGKVSQRFDQALDISFGTKEIFLQQPTRFYFPGLPQRAFFERNEFPWLRKLEAKIPAIKYELQAMLNGQEQFSPYLDSGSTEPNFVKHLDIVDSLNWSAAYLWHYGVLNNHIAEQCPNTKQALDTAPLPFITGQTPVALFSKLKAGVKIPPHHGLLNTRLICHLPIIVPKNCGGLRVGNETRQWEDGKALIFDDSIEHEAWNTSSEERVVLLFDIWRPELTEDEKGLITDMLIAVDEFSEQGKHLYITS